MFFLFYSATERINEDEIVWGEVEERTVIPVMLGEIMTNFESMESVTHKHALTNMF